MKLQYLLLSGLLGGVLVGAMGFFVGLFANSSTVAKTFGGWGTVLGGASGLLAGAIVAHTRDSP